MGNDVGALEADHYADIVAIDGDPLHDINATQAIRRVWCVGIEVIPG
jgi:imidazolonepropionase-like amidohydrolase